MRFDYSDLKIDRLCVRCVCMNQSMIKRSREKKRGMVERERGTEKERVGRESLRNETPVTLILSPTIKSILD